MQGVQERVHLKDPDRRKKHVPRAFAKKTAVILSRGDLRRSDLSLRHIVIKIRKIIKGLTHAPACLLRPTTYDFTRTGAASPHYTGF